MRAPIMMAAREEEGKQALEEEGGQCAWMAMVEDVQEMGRGGWVDIGRVWGVEDKEAGWKGVEQCIAEMRGTFLVVKDIGQGIQLN